MESTPQAHFVNLGIEIQNLPRVFVSLFGVDIYLYGVIVTLGFVIGLLYAYLEAKKIGEDPNLYIDMFFPVFIGSIVGARLYFVIFNWSMYAGNLLNIFNTRSGGLAIYGGILGGTLAAFLFTKVKKYSFRLLADVTTPGLLLGQAIGRWGNFFNREAFGGYTDSLFALRYRAIDVPSIPATVYEHMITVNGVDYIQIQPMFLYEFMANMILFTMLCLYKRRKAFDGEVALFYFLGYGVIRSVTESFRTDQIMLLDTNIPVSQALAVFMILMSAFFIVRGRMKVKAKV